MPNMRCFPTAGMHKQHDAVLESFGTTEEIHLFTQSPTVNILLSFPLLSYF